MLCMTTVFLCEAEVILQHGTVVGMCHLDEFLSLLHVALAAQVGYTVFGDYCINEVVGVVDVAGKRHNAADCSALGGRTAGEDAQVGIVGEVGTATDTVHHLGTANLGAVYVSVDVALYGCVQRAHTDTGDHLGTVAYLGGTQNQLVLEEVNVAVDTFQTLVGNGQRTRTGTQHTAIAHELYGSILEHLGVDVEVGDFRALAQCAKDGIGTTTHTALQVQETLGDKPLAHVVQQEVGNVLANLVGDGVSILETASLVGDVTLYDTYDTVGINLNVGLADAVGSLCYHDGFAEGMVLNLVNVVYALALGRVESVQFHDDTTLGQTAHRGADTTGGGQVDVGLGTNLLYCTCLDDTPVQLAKIALAHLCGQIAQVEVVVVDFVHVHTLAEVSICGVGCAEVDGLCICQSAVATLSGAGACDDADLEGTAGGMLGFGLLRYFCGSALGGTCGSKSAQANGVAVLYEGSSLGSSDFVEFHCMYVLFVYLLLVWSTRLL